MQSVWNGEISDMIMRGLFQISSKIIFLVLILALISALSSLVVFASMAPQEKSGSKEANPTEMIIEKNYDENNDYTHINEYFEFERKFEGKSSKTLQIESSWIDVGLPENPYRSSAPPLVNSNNQQAELTTIKQGFIGVYHPFKGKVYAGTGINDDEDLYQAYHFGVNGIINDPSYGAYDFRENIEKHCQEFDTNLVYGIIRPPSERGVVNNPNDTKLLEPASPSGMIQAAARFSKLSSIFPQIRGVIIDDFWANYYGNAITLEDMKNIKGALSGEKMLPDGSVDLESRPNTPDLQLFIVTYGGELRIPPDKDIIDMIDGVNFWLYDQEDSYNKFDLYLSALEAHYPNKELITGVYIHNGDYGDMSNQSISYLIDKGIQLYEKCLSSGILLFSGYWLVKDYISEERSQKIGLSDIFYSKYYPYLGEINCHVVDDETSRPLQGVKIKIYFNMARKITAAGKTTNEQGMFRFSGYAGRSGGVSYSFTAEKEGYNPYNGSFTIEANKSINLPSVNLKRLELDIESSVESHSGGLAKTISSN
jgi:hypothetical protein